ncbi:gamma-crystallin M2-like isoform X2 [Phyllopteryx taeniolatus]|uniref:gamma-crystallin M2-like isoform X2 n=1 Tax=Phyllopteryx taeniolatus TaxID=161469 RepID=UPI002AD2205F|nr:gamma-crystallin M2-like isoform X2 [Phyllopteryx taeniolatus]
MVAAESLGLVGYKRHGGVITKATAQFSEELTQPTQPWAGCQSCRVENGCFMVYERPNFMGNQYFMRRGEYADSMSMMGMRDCIRSCRAIPMHRGQFRMKIFEKENFSGQSNELQEDCDNIMDHFRMNDCMSCQVMEGHWLMFEHPQFTGKMMYVRPGEYRSFRELGLSSMRVMSMRRITDM